MEEGTTYDVRIYRTEVYKGAQVTTCRVRWKVGHRLWAEGFRNAAQADSFRSSLLIAARKGEAFSLSTGRPMSWKRDESAVSWYALTLDYTAAKWPYAAPNHRKSIAEALTDATEAMLASDEPPYPVEEIRRALRTWAFSDRLRAYLKVFHKARAAAFTGQEGASLLARRPYDLRHAAVSTWLNAGVLAPQVAEWAGHSVDVLLRVYAKCISGQQYEAKRRIEEATMPREDEYMPWTSG